jgi:hypothetical protein
MDVICPLIFRSLLDLKCRNPLIQDRGDHCSCYVSDLHLGGKKDGIVSREGIRSETVDTLSTKISCIANEEYAQDSKIGKTVHVCSHIRLGAAILLPLLRQTPAILPVYLHWNQELLDLEARCKYNDIKVSFDPVVAGDTGLVYRLYPMGQNFNIRAVQTLQIVWIKNTTLAAYTWSAGKKCLESLNFFGIPNGKSGIKNW